MTRGVFVALASALVLGLAVAGCGGGDDDSTALTKAEFVKAGNALCAKAEREKSDGLNAAVGELGKEIEKPAKQEELVIDVALPPVITMTEEMAALAPPSGDEEQIEKIISGYESGIEKVEADPSSAIAGTVEPFLQPDRDAVAYGMKACFGI